MPVTCPAGPTFFSEGDGRGSGAATDIDNAFTRFDPGAIDQDIGDRRQHNILGRLPVGPALAARSVPVGNLIGVLVVAYWCVHGSKLSVGPPSLPWQPRRDRA